MGFNARVALTLVLVAAASIGAADVTQFLEPIRAENAKITALNEEMESLAKSGDRDPAKLRDIGNRLREQAESFREVMRGFCGAETRRGLDEEVLLLQDSFITLVAMEKTYEELVAGGGTTVTPEERDELRGEIRAFTSDELRDGIEEELQSQGLLEKLGQRLFDEAVEAAAAQADAAIFSLVDERFQRAVNLGLHGRDFIGSLVRERARSVVRRHVATMLVKITSNELVIEWVAGVLLRWVGPELRELFRVKGNLEPRTERSIQTLKAAERRLHELPGDAKISKVIAELDSAQETIGATKFLFGDLNRARNRANQDDPWTVPTLLDRLKAQKERLKDVMAQTRRRFLLHKRRYEEDCKEAERELTRLIKNLGDSTGGGAGSGDAGDVAYVEFPPQYLIHIIETKTPGGPEERDVWILFGGKPDENGVLLTPDDYGGVFVNKTDQVHGPFTNSRQLCPVLKQVGLDGIWLGQRHISCKPPRR